MKACSECRHATAIGPAFRLAPACARIWADMGNGMRVAVDPDAPWRLALLDDARSRAAPCGPDGALFEQAAASTISVTPTKRSPVAI